MTQIAVNGNRGWGYPATPLMPPPVGGDHDLHTHSVQFYEDDAFLLDEVSRFLGGALAAGTAAVVIVTPPHRAGLASRLAARGLDLASAGTQGRYIALDAAETLAQFMGDGGPDGGRFAEVVSSIMVRAAAAAQSAQPRVAAFGEMVALLWAAGQPEAALHLEHLWNDLAHIHAFDLHCAYPMHFFRQADDGAYIGQICAAHSWIIPAEGYSALSNEEERLRAIVHLQQKAQALETEIAAHQHAQTSLQRREAELDNFLSVAAHELKTPITSLRGFAQLLLRDVRRGRAITPERLEGALQTVELQTGKLSRLVARLLDTTQIEDGQLRLAPVCTDLVALVQATLAQHPGAASHTFASSGPAQLEALVDPLRFEQALTNLLDNAVQFSPAGSLVTVHLEQDNTGGIRLSVTDQGVGIPPDQREQVFARVHPAHSDLHLSGLGLGLFLTREIAVPTGHQVACHPELAKGLSAAVH